MHRLARLASLCLLAACSNGVDPLEPADDVADLPEPSASAVAPKASAAPAASAEPPEPVPPGAERFEAVVRVSKERGDDEKRKLVFRGVTLDRVGAPQVVASYSPSRVWDALDGRKVSALGDPYTPQGRSIGGVHMSILELAVVDPSPSDTVVGFGRTKELVGKLSQRKGEPGSKAEGSSSWVFDSQGTRYEVFELPKQLEEVSGEVHVLAAIVKLSPFVQRAGGPFLWIRGKAKDSGDP